MADETEKRIRGKISRIVADNDQDQEEARRWFRDATHDDLMLVWAVIQRPYRDPAMEVMARLAQLKFGEMLVEKYGQPRG